MQLQTLWRSTTVAFRTFDIIGLRVIELHFFARRKTFLFGPQVVSRAPGCGARRGSRVHCSLRLDPVETHGACSGRRAIWVFHAGSLSAKPELTRPMETPKLPNYKWDNLLCTSILCHYYTSPETLYDLTLSR